MGKKKKSSAIHYLGIFKYTYKDPFFRSSFLSLALSLHPPSLSFSRSLRAYVY